MKKWLYGGLAAALTLLFVSKKKGVEMPPVFFRGGLPTSKRTKPIQYIVVHHSATTSAESTYNVLKKKDLSTHFEVDQSGKVWQYADPATETAWHAGPWNGRGIGIDLTGPINGQFTEAQKATLAQLIRALAAKFNIPLNMQPWGYSAALDPDTFKGIVAHANTKATKPDPSYTATTGDGALWNEMKARLA